MLSWAEKILIKREISPKSHCSILKTPWSEIHAFETDAGLYYLKRTPPELFIEVKVLKKLASSFTNLVPQLIASNSSLNCFITKDAGIPLRRYLHDNSDFKYLYKALDNFLELQRQIENSVEDYLALGVPDWRLNQIPKLFNTMLLDEELLSKEGLGLIEIQNLKELSTQLKAECEDLALFAIPQTLVQLDFHSNNILIDPESKKLTYIDLGEVVIAHPFFSVLNFLLQAVKHYGLRKEDKHYQKLILICEKHWPEFQKILPKVEKIFPVYSALGCYRLMKSIDINAYYHFYNQYHKLGDNLKNYLKNTFSNSEFK